MGHCTLAVSAYQFRRALGELLPDRLPRRALRATARRATRERLCPLWLLPALLAAWFLCPLARLPAVARWPHGSRRRPPAESAFYQARARLGWGPLRWLARRVPRFLAEA